MRKIPFAGIELTSQRVRGYMVPLSYQGDRCIRKTYTKMDQIRFFFPGPKTWAKAILCIRLFWHLIESVHRYFFSVLRRFCRAKWFDGKKRLNTYYVLETVQLWQQQKRQQLLHTFSLSMEMSRLTRDGTAEHVSRDQILRHEERGQGNIKVSCSADD